MINIMVMIMIIHLHISHLTLTFVIHIHIPILLASLLIFLFLIYRGSYSYPQYSARLGTLSLSYLTHDGIKIKFRLSMMQWGKW